jgi:phosphatidylserine decarboxylase
MASVLWIQTDEDDKVVFVLETPYHWQRPTYYVSVGERVGQGQRCGRTPFGGTVDLFIPASARPEVTHGDSVCAGVTVLATFNHDGDR